MAATSAGAPPPRQSWAWAWVSLVLALATAGVAVYGWLRVPPIIERPLPAPAPAPLDPALAAQAAELEAFRATLRAQIAEALAGIEAPVCRPGTAADPAALGRAQGTLAPKLEQWRRLPGLPERQGAAPIPDSRAGLADIPAATTTASAPRRSTAELRDLLEQVSVIVLALGAREGLGTGTGFFVAPDLLVTNRHVLDGADPTKIFVTSRRLGSIQPVSLLGQTAPGAAGVADFALLRLGSGQGPAALNLATTAQKLSAVIAAGYPGLGLANDAGFARLIGGDLTAAPDLNMNSGEIRSSVGSGTGAAAITRLVHTADVLKGYSGGPLIDGCGRAVGVNTFIQIDQQQASKLNNAISASDLAQFLTDQGVRATIDPAPCD